MALSDALNHLTKQPGDPDTKWLTPSRHRSSMTQAYADLARAGITTSAVNVTWSAATPVLTISDTATVTLPAASGNTGSVATIINIGSGTVTISRTSPDVIAGSLTTTSLPGRGTLRLVSDGTGWRVIDGSYSSSAVGLATYEWNHTAPGWRLVAYDSGVRLIAQWDASGVFTAGLTFDGWGTAAVTHASAGAAYLRRERTTLTLTLFGLRTTASTTYGTLFSLGGDTNATLPTGFRSGDNTSGRLNRGASSTADIIVGFFTSTTLLTVVAPSAESIFRTEWTYRSHAPLPTSLPGTEVAPPV